MARRSTVSGENGGGRPGRGAADTSAVPRGCIPIASGGDVMRPRKTAESVARDIVHDIIDQNLRSGAALPSEALMLAHYGVSRESLREGLRLLEVQGLISIRRGPSGGPVVGTVDPANLGRISTLYFHMAGATYEELYEVWMLAECTLAERAARHPDAATRAEAMAPYLAEHAPGADEEDLERFVEEHARFHAALASLVRNRVLELTLQTYGQIVSHHVATIDDPRELRQLIADDHHGLAQAIAAGHPKRARQLMEAHISGVATYNRDRLGTQLDELIEWL